MAVKDYKIKTKIKKDKKLKVVAEVDNYKIHLFYERDNTTDTEIDELIEKINVRKHG